MIDIEVTGENFAEPDEVRAAVNACRVSLEEEIEYLGLSDGLNSDGLNIEIALNLMDDEGIQEINLQHRDIDSATDVLSFPVYSSLSEGYDEAAVFSKISDNHSIFLGDIFISAERAVAQAAEYGHSLLRELVYLSVHACMHLCGYDHVDGEDEAAEMRAREKAIIKKLGIFRTEV